jgi:uncharacterized protein YutE (UPF0331/DUF86 family)
MNVNRREQYQTKLNFIKNKMYNLPENPNETESSIENFFQTIQTSIEASIEVIAMLCKDLDFEEGDIYTNLDQLRAINVFSPEFVKEMRQLNAMRYLIRQRFTSTDEKLLAEQKIVTIKILDEFVSRIDETISERLSHIK